MAVRPIGYGRLVGSLSAGGRPAAQPTFGGQTLRVDPSLLAGNQIGLLSTAGYPEADTQTDWRLVPLPSVADASPTDSPASPAVAVVPVDPKQIALERRVREDRNVVRAAAAFAGGDYAGSLMRLQIAQSRHPRSRLVRHMLIRSLLAQGNVPQAAFHTRVLLRESLGVVDLASLYTDAAYGSAARRSAHGKRLGALAASGRADESLHLLHAYWLIATGEPAAAGEALEKVGSPAYAGAAGRLGDLLK